MACVCVNKCADCRTALDPNSRQETAICLVVSPLAEVKDFIQRHGDDQTAPRWLQQVDAEAAETSFQKVTITIQAATPREAYEKLCAALASIDAEWTTDTFSVDGSEDRCTSELWPDADAVTNPKAD
jgi:putative lipoic acid-binding regulatory protein